MDWILSAYAIALADDQPMTARSHRPGLRSLPLQHWLTEAAGAAIPLEQQRGIYKGVVARNNTAGFQVRYYNQRRAGGASACGGGERR